jgi:excisionase family DNA binding protein
VLCDVEVEPINIGLKEACRVTGLGKTSIYALVKNGTLTIRKFGAKTLFDYAEVRDFARSIPVHLTVERQRRRSTPIPQQQTHW